MGRCLSKLCTSDCRKHLLLWRLASCLPVSGFSCCIEICHKLRGLKHRKSIVSQLQRVGSLARHDWALRRGLARLTSAPGGHPLFPAVWRPPQCCSFKSGASSGSRPTLQGPGDGSGPCSQSPLPRPATVLSHDNLIPAVGPSQLSPGDGASCVHQEARPRGASWSFTNHAAHGPDVEGH